jgi:hypothetical protein
MNAIEGTGMPKQVRLADESPGDVRLACEAFGNVHM